MKKELQAKLREEQENTKKYETIDKICKSKNKSMELFVKQKIKKKKFNYFDLNLRYCHVREVQIKLQNIIIQKQQFALRLKHLKRAGIYI